MSVLAASRCAAAIQKTTRDQHATHVHPYSYLVCYLGATQQRPRCTALQKGGWLRAALLGQMKNRLDRPHLTAPQVLLHHERQVDRVLIELAVTPLSRQVNTLGPGMLLSRQDVLPFPSPRHQYKHT